MSFGTLVAKAIEADSPVALVGIDADGVDLAASIAESLGHVVVRIGIDAIGRPAETMTDARSKRTHVLIIEGCSSMRTSDEAVNDGRTDEDALLDLAFDGDPSLPARCTIVMCFAEPTRLSDALAEDEIPCTVLSPDMGESEGRTSIAGHIAAELRIPLIDVPLADDADRVDALGLPDAA